MPGLVTALGAGTGTVQLTLSLFLLGMAVSQLVLGPLSDRFGRRPVMLAGLALTVIASFAALAATSIAGLIVARTFQAFGATVGIVIGRAIIRDLYDRDRAASMIGWVTMAMVIAPMIAPLIGGALDTAFGWQAIFAFIGAVRRRGPRLGDVPAARDAHGRGRRRLRALHRGLGEPAHRPQLPRLRAGRGDQFGDVLHLHRRRAACRRDADAPLVGRIRRLVRVHLARPTWREISRPAAGR